MTENKNIPFTKVIETLLDDAHPFPAFHLHRFSDLSVNELEIFKKTWPEVNPTRRVGVLEDLEELAEADPLLCFDELAKFALEDENPLVRETAIHLLWESEDAKLAPRFMKILLQDTDDQVRAAAAGALGLFVYLGELDEIPETIHQDVELCLLDQFMSNGAKSVRRKVLESLGYSGRGEVSQLIKNAFATNEKDWMASALCAMGRSADPQWEKDILKMLDHPFVPIQEEAIHAAGTLELSAARQPLLELLEEKDSLDSDVLAALIWALSQIGGENVRAALEELAENAEDDAELEYLESALENLEFTENFELKELFDFDLDSQKHLDDLDTDSGSKDFDAGKAL
ncbi:MAG: HEAT repeat domain-containing protein [Anaerolineaceae bacterium]|nr:HEAT repeat domain-containing protein [Anaerolineaceae bacterium]